MPGHFKITFVCCIYFAGLFSQQNQDSINRVNFISPHNPKGDYNTRALKGKLLPWIFAQAMGANLLLGYEFGFCKNHSVGADVYINNMEGDSDPDSNNVIKSYYMTDKAIFINYRYYLNFPALRRRGVIIYSGTLGMHGKKWESSDPGYSSDGFLTSLVKYNGLGVLAGTLICFKENEGLALDVNFRFFYRQKSITDVHFTNSGYVHSTAILGTYDLGIGLNLYWYNLRKKK